MLTHRPLKCMAIGISIRAISTTMNVPVGWSKLAYPYYVLTDRLYEVESLAPDASRPESDSLLTGR